MRARGEKPRSTGGFYPVDALCSTLEQDMALLGYGALGYLGYKRADQGEPVCGYCGTRAGISSCSNCGAAKP